MSNLIQFQSFDFHSNSVRVITDPNQEFWFCGVDVCNILGYENSRATIQKHCKQGGVSKRYTPTQSGEQEMIFINEPNLYRLIIKSRKPEAEPFEAWVFEEVLPQIRKSGQYSVQQPLALSEPEKKYTFEFTENQLIRFITFWFALYKTEKFLQEIQGPLLALGSRYGDEALNYIEDYQLKLGVMKRLLAPMMEKVDFNQIGQPYHPLALKTFNEYKPQGISTIVKV